ncbi:MAG: RimK-like ATPgrasp N-terminal domain-containing protein [Candidatus Methanoperedens sp.]|nr:RimK-like ATPgrasp N-terminal domain-containing protein [Candidatus Methanoperedens sp.]MCZ7370092.1 RimK-like ATPgrasp N-terminal domain-containing protein [Candidatus Methanoperedens sp.]
MIIVSEDEDDSDSSPLFFLRQPVQESVLNITHDYRYLRMGYYVSAHAETFGVEVTPSCTEIMDAYRNPLLIEKARRNGLRTNGYRLITKPKDDLATPALLFAVNPFTNNSMKVVKSGSRLPGIIKKMSFDARFPVSLHPLTGEVLEIIQMFGESNNDETSEFAKKFFEVFNIPICKLVVQVDDGQVVLNHCEPAMKKEVKWDIVHEKVLEIRRKN